MESTLLATKLRIPALARHLVPRAGLSTPSKAESSIIGSSWLSAPAGYGKTTLLAQWAHASRCPVAWLSLSAEDNDPDRFFRYLLAAWEEVQPGIRDSSLGLLLGAMDPDRDAVLSAFINVASDLSDHLVIVLDDYHVIDEPSIHAALNFLLDNLPPTLHVVLAGRSEPPLPLARYRARGDVLRSAAKTFASRRRQRRPFSVSCCRLHFPRRQSPPCMSGWKGGPPDCKWSATPSGAVPRSPGH